MSIEATPIMPSSLPSLKAVSREYEAILKENPGLSSWKIFEMAETQARERMLGQPVVGQEIAVEAISSQAVEV